jgi:branched-subunit amino acid transport protein
MSGPELLLVLGMAVAVYTPKVVPLVMVSARHASRLQLWLRYVAPAVLGALVAPSIVAPAGRISMPGWELAAYLLAGLVAAVTRRLLVALAAGATALVLVTLLQPR